MNAKTTKFYPDKITDPILMGKRCDKPTQCLQLRKDQSMYGSNRETEYQAMHSDGDC